MEQLDMYVDIMLDSLKRKKSYLEKILAYTEKQDVIAVSEEFDENEFENTVNNKEILINNINEIDKGFASVYDRIRVRLMEKKEDYSSDLKAMQGLIKECMDIGIKIEVLEERNRLKLENHLTNRQKNYRQVKQSKNIANKYYKNMIGSAMVDSKLYDRKK